MVWWVTAAGQAVLQTPLADGRVVPYVFILGGLLFLWQAVREWQRRRLVADTPTETVRSAAAGRTEIEGAGYPVEEPVERPFADEECLAARYRIDRPGDSSKTIPADTRWRRFEVDDGTGSLRVEPDDETTFEFDGEHSRTIRVDGGEPEPPAISEFLRASDRVDSQEADSIAGSYFAQDRRYIEWWIPVGADVYVFGSAEPDDDSGLVLRRDEPSDEFIVSALGPSDALSRTGHGVEFLLFGAVFLIGIGLYALVTAM